MTNKKAITAYNAIRDLCKEMNDDCASCPFYGLQPYGIDKECEFVRGVVPEGWEPINYVEILGSSPEKKDSEKITNDTVNHSLHYASNKIEVIDFIEDKGLGFHLGNAIKYISRVEEKDLDKIIENLEKAVWHVNRQIARLEAIK